MYLDYGTILKTRVYTCIVPPVYTLPHVSTMYICICKAKTSLFFDISTVYHTSGMSALSSYMLNVFI